MFFADLFFLFLPPLFDDYVEEFCSARFKEPSTMLLGLCYCFLCFFPLF